MAVMRERAARLFFSDRRLVTQDGHNVAYYTDVLKNNVVLINFFFTQCTDSCPTQSARLEEVQTLLRANPRPRVRLVSVSVDPAHDSPARSPLTPPHGTPATSGRFLPDRGRS